MMIHMNEAQVRIQEQASEVLAGTQELQLGPVADETGSYASIEQALKRFDYRCLKRMELSAVLMCLMGIRAYSRTQVRRLV